MDLAEKVRALVSKFGMLSEAEIELIIDKTIVDFFSKDTVLLKEGQVPTKCYMVIEGCVREYIIKDGEEKSTAFFFEGDTFTPHVRDGKPSRHYWECMEDCVLTISDKGFEESIRNAIPRLESVFQEIAIEKINRGREEWTQFVTSSPEERYLNVLETKPYLLNRIPLRHVASYLGMKPQSLSRIRKRLVDK
ncbi:MAG: Crp/Fnr family transcriptional regulator [Bacteroidia bacterium]